MLKSCPRILSSTGLVRIALGTLVLAIAFEKTTVAQPPDPRSHSVTSIDEMFLFFPSKYPEGNWKPDDLKFEDLTCTAKDGTRLHGWYCEAERPRCVMLVAHGNAGHVANRAPLLKFLQTEMHVSVYMFDYRGYGRSAGSPSADGVISDGRAARARLAERANVPQSQIVLMGESLGGAVVCKLASESEARGLILQSTFSSMRDVADVHYPNLSWVVPRTKLDSVTSIRQYRGPLLLSHGDADRIVPFSLGEKLFKSANQPKTFVKIRGADHNDWFTDEYIDQLDQFIKRLEQPPARK